MRFFENKRLRGAVSIFLVIITIPTMLFSAILIDGSRISSAKAMTQEATDLAAASVLASYNQQLKDQYGLLALKDGDQAKLESIYKESLNATLLAYGMSGDSAYSERLWEIMKTSVLGQKSYMGESFLNLYDFSVDQCTVEPLYSLANQDVLESQMVEYAKFRGLYVMADRMDILNNLGNAQTAARQNEATSEVMEEKMDVDEENAVADRELVQLRQDVELLNSSVSTMKAAKEDYIKALEAKMAEIRLENTDVDGELSGSQKKAADDYEKCRREFEKAAEAAYKQAGKILTQAQKAKAEVEKAIGRLEDFQSGNQGKASGNDTVGSMVQDAQENIQLYKDEYLPGIEALLKDATLKKLSEDSGLSSDLKQLTDDIHEAITKYMDEIRDTSHGGGDDEGEQEVTEYFYYYLNDSDSTTDISAAVHSGGASRSYEPAVDKKISYFEDKTWDTDSVNPSKRYEGQSNDKIDMDFAKHQSEKTVGGSAGAEGEAEKRSVDDAVYSSRPSSTFQAENGKGSASGFYNEEGSLAASKNVLNQGKHSMILDIGETVRDDVLGFTYMFGTFKTRLTGVEKFTSKTMPESDKNFYMPKGRYAHPEGELDMRFTPKRDRDTVLRSEIEYLVYGNSSDVANEAAVYSTIFAERMANNLLVMYAHKKTPEGAPGINPCCHGAAAAASFATGGWVPEPVFFWIFLTAWATAETYIEMEYLISDGYKIPLVKTTKNILLYAKANADKEGLISNYGEEGVFVSYEDYLLMLLLIKGKNKRIMRTADLIEMNMKKAGQSDFTMARAYTYLHADTELSIRYLFGSVVPFKESYSKGGYSGRISYTNTIYQGY